MFQFGLVFNRVYLIRLLNQCLIYDQKSISQFLHAKLHINSSLLGFLSGKTLRGQSVAWKYNTALLTVMLVWNPASTCACVDAGWWKPKIKCQKCVGMSVGGYFERLDKHLFVHLPSAEAELKVVIMKRNWAMIPLLVKIRRQNFKENGLFQSFVICKEFSSRTLLGNTAVSEVAAEKGKNVVT